MMQSKGEIPDNANEYCPSTLSEDAGKAAACAGCPNQDACASAPKGPDPALDAMKEQMASVKHKILVVSGKGGVGKSTFSAQLAFALAAMDYQVGLLDIDICGPSIPKMLGLEGQDVYPSNFGWSPVYVEANLGVMSIGFVIPPDHDVTWRGPRKSGMIKQFLKGVYWGELDFLVVDTPPGTSDEHIDIVQLLQNVGIIDGAIVVTTPQQVALADVRKGIAFCKRVKIPVLGVVENMSGLCQPVSDIKFMRRTKTDEHEDATEWVMKCLKEREPELMDLFICSEVFNGSCKGGAARMCIDMGVPFLGKVPLDPELGKAAEEGRSCFTEDSRCRMSAPALKRIIDGLVKNEIFMDVVGVTD